MRPKGSIFKPIVMVFVNIFPRRYQNAKNGYSIPLKTGESEHSTAGESEPPKTDESEPLKIDSI
ncbi:hypothetical protein SAMN02927921_01092 [Sinomicrobium oceani]|uniref:Uncharacterized protein n=1 Tax=Sinomicrobium oceani TaxID=1150368 RepID=A0A1K1N875_9FLAO|nr:hypothetical protein SAMN02927921_01092 [Sinomicrobium oceani]